MCFTSSSFHQLLSTPTTLQFLKCEIHRFQMHPDFGGLWSYKRGDLRRAVSLSIPASVHAECGLS